MEEDMIEKYGMFFCDGIEVVTIIGEIEGHDASSAQAKVTKYEHILPKLCKLEMCEEVKGVLFLINTVGGDVSCGLAIAEMIAGMNKPSVSLVLGDSHSIGVPIAVSTDYSYIVPSATMILHPVRLSGTVLGADQTMRELKSIQDRVVSFVAGHSNCPENEIVDMIMNTEMMAKDLGTILVGQEAVNCGLIDEIGDIAKAYKKLMEFMGK